MILTSRLRWKHQLSRATWIRLVVACGVSLGCLVGYQLGPRSADWELHEAMLKAAQETSKTFQRVRELREASGIPLDAINDPNRTGLIGLPDSAITTTLGHLEAKRTTTNPDFAALIVLLLREAGVGPGDVVAIGASASFPALVIASLHAVEALDAIPRLIVSLTASTYGANDPALTILDMLSQFPGGADRPPRLIAAAIGGEGDVGKYLTEEARVALQREIDLRGISQVVPGDLADAVIQRMALYEDAAGDEGIACFVNIGGAWANLGTDSAVLRLPPGVVNEADEIPAIERRGVLMEFLDRDIPAVHLLNIQGLALRYGAPWDPIPIPPIGQSDVYVMKHVRDARLVVTASLWLGAMVALIAQAALSRRGVRQRRTRDRSAER